MALSEEKYSQEFLDAYNEVREDYFAGNINAEDMVSSFAAILRDHDIPNTNISELIKDAMPESKSMSEEIKNAISDRIILDFYYIESDIYHGFSDSVKTGFFEGAALIQAIPNPDPDGTIEKTITAAENINVSPDIVNAFCEVLDVQSRYQHIDEAYRLGSINGDTATTGDIDRVQLELKSIAKEINIPVSDVSGGLSSILRISNPHAEYHLENIEQYKTNSKKPDLLRPGEGGIIDNDLSQSNLQPNYINGKFELGEKTTIGVDGRLTEVYQIVAKKEFVTDTGVIVRPGKLGGYVENKENLSQHGNSWIFPGAACVDYGRVQGNAVISDHANIYDHAVIYGNAEISGSAQVFGGSIVRDNARIGEDAKIRNADIYDRAKISGSAEIGLFYYEDEQTGKYGPDKYFHLFTKIYGDSQISGHAIITEGSYVEGKSVIDGGEIRNSTITDAFIKDHAIVKDSKVSGEVKIFDSVKIYDSTTVSGYSAIMGYSEIRGRSQIVDCVISGDSQIYNGAVLEKEFIHDKTIMGNIPDFVDETDAKLDNYTDILDAAENLIEDISESAIPESWEEDGYTFFDDRIGPFMNDDGAPYYNAIFSDETWGKSIGEGILQGLKEGNISESDAATIIIAAGAATQDSRPWGGLDLGDKWRVLGEINNYLKDKIDDDTYNKIQEGIQPDIDYWRTEDTVVNLFYDYWDSTNYRMDAYETLKEYKGKMDPEEFENAVIRGFEYVADEKYSDNFKDLAETIVKVACACDDESLIDKIVDGIEGSSEYVIVDFRDDQTFDDFKDIISNIDTGKIERVLNAKEEIIDCIKSEGDLEELLEDLKEDGAAGQEITDLVAMAAADMDLDEDKLHDIFNITEEVADSSYFQHDTENKYYQILGERDKIDNDDDPVE